MAADGVEEWTWSGESDSLADVTLREPRDEEIRPDSAVVELTRPLDTSGWVVLTDGVGTGASSGVEMGDLLEKSPENSQFATVY